MRTSFRGPLFETQCSLLSVYWPADCIIAWLDIRHGPVFCSLGSKQSFLWISLGWQSSIACDELIVVIAIVAVTVTDTQVLYS